MSTCSPAPNYLILDKFIAIAEYKGITPIVVITKTDLGDSSEICDIYGNIGIDVIPVDYDSPETVDTVRKMLAGKIVSLDLENGKANVSVDLFGQETNVELELTQFTKE